MPSFLPSDPDFAGPAPTIEATNPDDPEDESEASVEPAAVEDDTASVNATFASAAVGSATTGSTFKLGVHKTPYKDLPLHQGSGLRSRLGSAGKICRLF